jgi:formylglycine-generating enzyme required for sulfatase activity
MGSPEGERGRQLVEGPRRRVVMSKGFALGRFEVTVDQFGSFLADAGIAPSDVCRTMDTITGRPLEARGSFRQPGFKVEGSHPAVCVSWFEAEAYAAWLRRRTGKAYRLPSEAEWEYAARAGTTTSYSFGIDESELCQYARFADLSSSFRWRGGCRSGTTALGPLTVGKLRPNPWGIFDMHGNAWEWVADCWIADVRMASADGSVSIRPGSCEVGVARGGSWAAGYERARSAFRLAAPGAFRYNTVGIRVALSLDLP